MDINNDEPPPLPLEDSDDPDAVESIEAVESMPPPVPSHTLAGSGEGVPPPVPSHTLAGSGEGVPPPVPSHILEGSDVDSNSDAGTPAEEEFTRVGSVQTEKLDTHRSIPTLDGTPEESAAGQKLGPEVRRSNNSSPEPHVEGASDPPAKKNMFAARKAIMPGLTSEEELQHFLEKEYVLATRHDAKSMIKALLDLTHETGRRTLVHSYSVLSLLHMKRVKMLLLLLSALCIAQLTYFLAIIQQQTTQASVFRFTVEELRRTHLVHTNNVANIGVSNNRCVTWGAVLNRTETSKEASITIAYPTPMSMNGFSVRLDGPIEEDPVRWTVQAITAAGDGEEEEERPVLRDRLPEWVLGPPEDREAGATHMLEVLSDQFWKAFMVSVVSVVGTVLISLLAMLGLVSAARQLLSLILVLVALSFLVGEFVLGGSFAPTLAMWGDAFILILLAPTILFASLEKHLAQALMAGGVVGFILLSVDPDVWVMSQWLYFRQRQMLMSLLAGLGLGLFAVRRVLLERLGAKIRQDTAAFDAALRAHFAKCHRGEDDDSDFVRVVDELAGCAQCNRHHCMIPAHEVVQTSLLKAEVRTRREMRREGWSARWWRQLRRLYSGGLAEKEAKLTRELEMLYAQGSACVHLLREKCKELAGECDGMFPLEGRPKYSQTRGVGGAGSGWARMYVRWGEVQADHFRLPLVQWTAIKPYKRAMEKVVYHLDGETARLLDVTRETIVFETLRDIARCLRAMKDDPEIVLLETKNTLDEDDDGQRSAGFRAVFVKLQLVTEYARRLATDTHVCELILTLRCVADLVSDQSYEDYILRRRLLDAGSRAERHRKPVSAADHWARLPSRALPQEDSALSGSGVRHTDLNPTPPSPSGLPTPEGSMTLSTLRFDPASRPSEAPHTLPRPTHSFLSMFYPRPPQKPPNRVFPQQDSPQQSFPHQGSPSPSPRPPPLNLPIYPAPPPPANPAPASIAVEPVPSNPAPRNSPSADARLARPRGSQTSGLSVPAWEDTLPQRGASPAPRRSAERVQPGAEPSQTSPSGAAEEARASEERRASVERRASIERQPRTLEESLQRVFMAEFRKRTTLADGDLDSWWQQLGKATATANFAKVFNTSFPITSAMGKRWFVGWMLVIGFICLGYSLYFVLSVNLSGRLTVSKVRFTVHSVRSGQAGAESGFRGELEALGLGLTNAGCRTELAEEHGERTVVVYGEGNTRVEVNLFNVTRMDAFFFKTNPADAALDPTVFELEVQSPGGGGWQRAGSSRKFVQRDGRLRWLLEEAAPPGPREARVEVGLAVPLYAVLRQAVSPAVVCLAALSLGRLALLAANDWGKPTICVAALVTGAFHLAEGVCRLLDGNFNVLPLPLVTGAGLGLFAGVVWRHERNFMEAMSLVGLLLLACAAVEDLVLDPGDEGRLWDQVPSVFVLLVGGVLLAVRWRATRKAVQSIQRDLQMYEKVWEERVLGKPEEAQSLGRIPLVLARTPVGKLEVARVRQQMHTALPASYRGHDYRSQNRGPGGSDADLSRGRRRHSVGAGSWLEALARPLRRLQGRPEASAQRSRAQAARRGSNAGHFMERSVTFFNRSRENTKVPVNSLKVLYTQAAALQPMVLEKVKQWALVSRGRFPTQAQNGEELEFVLWESVAGDWWKEATLRFASLKKPQRAIEKLVRTYGGKVWMLQDLVRQSIVFDKTAELVMCLRAIVDDPEVTVINAKNRLTKAHDPLSSAGYRDVHLNLQMCTALAEKLGVDTHVFEIQLQLKAYSSCKISGGHRRYVAFRNALCM